MRLNVIILLEVVEYNKNDDMFWEWDQDSSDVLKPTKRKGIEIFGQEKAMGKYSFIYFRWPCFYFSRESCLKVVGSCWIYLACRAAVPTKLPSNIGCIWWNTTLQALDWRTSAVSRIRKNIWRKRVLVKRLSQDFVNASALPYFTFSCNLLLSLRIVKAVSITSTASHSVAFW
jgi:hypothetical protein